MRLLTSLTLGLYCMSLNATQQIEYRRYIGFDVGNSIVNRVIHHKAVPQPVPPPGIDCHTNEWRPECVRPVMVKSRHSSQFLNAYTGFRMGQYAAFEIGGFSNFPDRQQNKSFVSVVGLHMGFVFILPIAQRLELLPGVGIAHATVHAYEKNVVDYKENGLIPRLLVGAQYKLTERFKLRGSVAWHRTSGVYSDNLSMHNMLNVGVGLNYNFEEK